MNVTIAQIAERVGVNHGTVSRVLNGNAQPKYKPAIARAREIRRVAKELGYRPHVGAQATASGRFNTVSLIISNRSWRSVTPGTLLQSIGDELEQTGTRLDLACLPDRRLTDPEYLPTVLSQRHSDGLLINYHAAIPQTIIKLIEDAVLPSVWINTKRGHDCVHPDDLAASQQATEHLLTLGHRRIAYVDLAYEVSKRAGVRHYSKPDRKAGYKRAMKAAGLEPQFVFDNGELDQPDVDQTIREMLEAPDRPTATVAYGRLDLDVIQRVGSRMGLFMPEDISAITFEAGRFGPGCLRTTKMVVPEELMGRAAVRMLRERIIDPSIAHDPIALPFDFQEGLTTRPFHHS